MSHPRKQICKTLFEKSGKAKRLGAMHKRETELLTSFLSCSKVAWAGVPDAPHNTINLGCIVAETVVVCFWAVASVTIFDTSTDASWFMEKCIKCCLLSMRRQHVSSEEQHTGDVLTRKEGGGWGQGSEEYNRGKHKIHYASRVHSSSLTKGCNKLRCWEQLTLSRRFGVGEQKTVLYRILRETFLVLDKANPVVRRYTMHVGGWTWVKEGRSSVGAGEQKRTFYQWRLPWTGVAGEKKLLVNSCAWHIDMWLDISFLRSMGGGSRRP